MFNDIFKKKKIQDTNIQLSSSSFWNCKFRLQNLRSKSKNSKLLNTNFLSFFYFLLGFWLVNCRTSASPTAQGRTQGSTFTLSCASPSSLPSGTSLPSWSCSGTGARSPSTSATRRSVWPRHNTPRVGGWSEAHTTTVSWYSP